MMNSASTGTNCPFQEQQTYNQVNNRTWWPNNLNLNPLKRGDPTSVLKGYAEEFNDEVLIRFLVPYFLFATNEGDGDDELCQLSFK